MSQTLENVELVMWNFPGGEDSEPPQIDTVRGQMRAAELNADHATDISHESAFRRACDQLRAKDMLVRIFKHQKTLACQVDQEAEFDGNQLPRTMKGSYMMSGSSRILRLAYDSDHELQETLTANYLNAQEHYQWGDISRIIQDVLTKDGLGAYSPRKAGGCYFVPHPNSGRRFLDRIASFCSTLGIRFLRYAVPDTESQRAEIRESIASSLRSDIDEHAAAIAEYTEDTRFEVFGNRKNALNAVGVQIIKLMSLLNGSATELMQRLDGLTAEITQLEQRSQNRSAGPVRRIIMPTIGAPA